jgi:Protein of unknown function (DUF2569)
MSPIGKDPNQSRVIDLAGWASSPQDCPVCGLTNPHGTNVCECGYDFIQKHAPLEPFAHLGTDHPLYGIDGWLMLFCAGQTILFPVYVLLAVVTGFVKTPFVIAFQVALCGFSVYTGVSVWRMRPNALRLVRAFLIVILVLGFVDAFPPHWIHLKCTTRTAIPGIRNLVVAALWWLYFKLSKRVKVTFGQNL